MKLIPLTPIFSLLVAGLPLVTVSCSKHESSQSAVKTLYTCGMHPQVIQDHPGNCPICGMKLTPIHNHSEQQASVSPAATVASPAEHKISYYKSTMIPGETSKNPGKDSMGMDMVPVYEQPSEESSSTISIDPVTVQNMGIRTEEVKRGPVERTIRTVGVIDYNETAQTDVTVRYRGWIEKLYVDATGKDVKKGEPLLEIYSPDLVTAQNEYLLALQAGAGSGGLKQSAIMKLKNLDVSPEQIGELERTRKIKRTLQVTAPRNGIVVEKMAVEGQMVDPGMKLYRLADLSLVWVQSQIYEQDLAFIRLGQEAEVSLSYLPDRKFSGRVTYLYPTVDEKTRTARVRMEFHNPGLFLKPGMFAKVKINSELEKSAVLVPDSAVLRSGEKNTVFVAREGGKFDPRTITLGPRSKDGYYKVDSGLKEGERVVTSGQFMMDSESQLKEAIQKMTGAAKPETESEAATQPSTEAPDSAKANPSPSGWQPTPEPEPAHYVCPMPEHSSILYDHSGKCPICGMTLIPADNTQPEQKPQSQGHESAPDSSKASSQSSAEPVSKPNQARYVCPMPEHPKAYDHPGKCPLCGMALVLAKGSGAASASAETGSSEHSH